MESHPKQLSTKEKNQLRILQFRTFCNFAAYLHFMKMSEWICNESRPSRRQQSPVLKAPKHGWDILDIQGLQSDRPLSTLGLNVVNSAPFTSRRQAANHSPRTPRGKQTSSKDIWSGDFPFLSNTLKYLHRGHFRYPCTKTTWTHCHII
jgi:hypothetical protein